MAIGLVAGGMVLLGLGAHGPQVAMALAVGATIGVYTVNDSNAVRDHGTTYAFALFVTIGLSTTLLGVSMGRSAAMRASLRTDLRRHAVTGTMSAASYVLVLVAVRRAPVGYVSALRESSVLIAAFLGTRYLAESHARRRTVAAAVILTGLVLLITTA